MPDLSVIIPARSEMFLSRTIDDLLANIRGNTEIIAVLDGNWPDPPVKDNPKVTLIYHSQSIGQRAACNEAARYSRAKYIAKCDAHCGFDEGFDVVLMKDMKPEYTMAPIMRNLFAFQWICPDGHTRYQGPSGPCKECEKPTQMDIKWIAKTNPQSTAFCLDETCHFQYMGDMKQRQEYKKSRDETGLTETMSLQGSFFMMTREKYFELGMNDESLGSWGTQGGEVALRTWLSGGRVVINHACYYAHLFRTQGQDFGFPYQISGRQVEKAKKGVRNLFFNNQWPKQVKPFSWLLDKFWPVPMWSDEARTKITEAGRAFRPTLSVIDPSFSKVSMIINPLTDFTSSHDSSGSLDTSGRRQEMPSDAMSLPTIDGCSDVGSKYIIGITDQDKMEGIDAGSIVANNVVKNRDISTSAIGNGANKPSIHESMNQKTGSSKSKVAIPESAPVSSPDPALSQGINGVNLDLPKNSRDGTCGKGGDNEIIGINHSSYLHKGNENRLESGGCLNHSPDSTIISPPIAPVKLSSPTRGIVYYSDNLLTPDILIPCQNQLARSVNGLPIVSVTLKPMAFGENYTLPLERSILTMFKQILEGIKRSTADILFFTEHDCLYTREHFLFTPPRRDVFYYNENQWQVDATSGRALFYHCMRLSAMCAYRELLLEHYTKRVERFEKEPFTLRCGYEPGGHRYPRGIDNYTRDRFMTPYPLIDLRHTGTVSPNRWRKRDFRNQGPLWAWVEADAVPYFGKTKGRMPEFLKDVSNGKYV